MKTRSNSSIAAKLLVFIKVMTIGGPALAQGIDIGRIITDLAQGAIRGQLQQRPALPAPVFPSAQRAGSHERSQPSENESISGPQHGLLYQADGLALGGQLNIAATNVKLTCSASPKHAAMQFCQGQDRHSFTSVYLNSSGIVSYFSKYFGNIQISRAGVAKHVRRFSSSFGRPRILDETNGADGSYSVILTWGTLSPVLMSNAPDTENSTGVYLQYQRAGMGEAQIYDVQSGSGFYLVATFNRQGRGNMRYGGYDQEAFSNTPSNAIASTLYVGTTQAGTEKSIIPPAPTIGRLDRNAQGNMRLNLADGAQHVEQSAADTKALSGEWVGQASCDGPQRDLSLTFHPSTTAYISATAAFFRDDALVLPVPHFEMLARQDGNSNVYQFVPQSSSDRLTFTANLSANGKTLTATAGSCGSFVLRKVEAPDGQAGLVALPGKQIYDPSAPLQKRCEIIARWASRLTREYPGLDLHHTSMDKLYPNAVHLFADNDFVAAFSFAYDAAAVDVKKKEDATQERVALGEIGRDLYRQCGQDPFIRQSGIDFWGNSLFQSAFPSTIISPFAVYFGGSFSIPAIRHFVQTTRIVSKNIHDKLTAARDAPNESIADLLALRAYVGTQGTYLWPSELSKAETDAKKLIEARALREGEQELSRLRNETDPVKGLNAARVMLAGGETSAIKNMDNPDRERYVRNIEDTRHHLAAVLEAPFQTQIGGVTDDLQGIRDLRDIMSRARSTVDLFSDADRLSFNSGITDKMKGMLQRFVTSDLKSLKSYPTSSDGLKLGCHWIADYDQKYKEFESYSQVAAGVIEFRNNRAIGLASSVKEITAAKTAKPDLNLHTILCWAGDRSLPESLEYDVLSANSGSGPLW